MFEGNALAQTSLHRCLGLIDMYAVNEDLYTFTFDASAAFLHVPERELVIVAPPDVFH